MMQVRLHTLVFVLCALWACTPEAPATDDDLTQAMGTVTVRGLVCDGDCQPLEGVVVSDGFKCVSTDDAGIFELDSNLDVVRFVHISIPSGYTVPTRNGLPQFYRRLSEEVMSDGCYQLEFVLDRMTENPDIYSVMMVGDPQPRGRDRAYDKVAFHSLDCCNDLYRDMRETGAAIRRSRPCYAIMLGDIVHEDTTLFAPYIEEGTSKMGFPTFNVIGNHDHYTGASTDEKGAVPFENHFGPTNYSFNLGKIHFVVVDNMIQSLKNGSLTSSATGLRDDIMQWVKSDLSFVDKTSTVFLCSHAPMFSRNKSFRNQQALASELAKFRKVHVWAGHVHQMINESKTSVSNLESHSVVRATGELWTNEYLSCGMPRGYVLIEVDGDDISWKFKPTVYQTGQPWSTVPEYNCRRWNYVNGVAKMKSTGQTLDDSYQMNVYPRGTYGDNYVYANIFMWDEEWEVPVYVTSEGVEYKMSMVMERNYRYDAGAKEIHDFYTANSSKYQKEWTPVDGDTFFRVYSNKTTETGGYVKVKDRFGNEYTQEVKW